MKNHNILFAICLFISINALAQEENDVNLNEINSKKHEVRLDVLEAILAPAIELNYEYVLSRYTGVGASINVNVDNDDEELGFAGQKFAFTPYFRQYFFNKKDYGARGFYAEGLLQYTSGQSVDFETDFTTGFSTLIEEDWSAFGIGFAIGQKWVSRNGFVLELSIGVGRNLTNDEFAPDFFARGGLNFGYRF